LQIENLAKTAGRFTIVFDNLTDLTVRDCDDTPLEKYFFEIFQSAQYHLSDRVFSFADEAVANLIEQLRHRGKELDDAPNGYLFAVYEDILKLNSERLKEFLHFHKLASARLDPQSREAEVHLFCVLKQTNNDDERLLAHKNMLDIVECLAQQVNQEKIRPYLLIYPNIYTRENFLEDTVRWLYLASRIARPYFFDEAVQGNFFNLTYVGYHVETNKKNRKRIEAITARLGDNSFSEADLYSLVKKNFETVLADCLQYAIGEVDKRINDIVPNMPVPKEVTGHPIINFFRGIHQTKSAAICLTDAIRDTYYHAVHVPFFINSTNAKFGENETPLLNRVFYGTPLEAIVSFGQAILQQLHNELDVRTVTIEGYHIRPTWRRKELLDDMYAATRFYREQSKQQLPVIVINKLIQALPTELENLRCEKEAYIKERHDAERDLELKGGKHSSDEFVFIRRAKQALRDNVTMPYVVDQSFYDYLITNNATKEYSSTLSGEDGFTGIFCLDGDQSDVLQAFRLMKYELNQKSVTKRIFSLFEDDRGDEGAEYV